MNEIAKGALLLVTGLVLNSSLADWYRGTVMWNGITEQTTRQFEADRDGVDTLILGDSHAKRGLYPSVLGKAFNLAIPGESYTETYYVLESRIEDDALDLRTVILSADLHSLSSWSLDRFSHVHYYARFVDYFEIGTRRGQPLLYTVRGLQGRFAPYLSGRRNILSYFETDKPNDLIWLQGTPLRGGALVDKRTHRKLSTEEKVGRAVTRVGYHLEGKDSIAPIFEAYFLRALELCHAHNIAVILVQYPVTPEYLEVASEHIDIDAFDRHIAKLAQAYENVQLVKWRTVFEDRPSLFLDSDHLNEQGATVFSSMIKRRILDPIRRRQQS